MAAQTVLLLVGAGPIPVLRLGASLLSAAGASGLAFIGLTTATPHAPAVAAFVAVALTASAWLFRRRMQINLDRIAPVAFAYVIPALILGMGAIWDYAGATETAGWMALSAVVFAILPRKLNLRELTLAGQALLPAGAVIWLASRVGAPVGSWVEPSLLTLAGVSLSLWWARQSRIPLPGAVRGTLEGTAAFCAAIVAAMWTQLSFRGSPELIATAVLGTAWIIAAVLLRARFLGLAGGVFTFLSVVQFVTGQRAVHWAVALLPIAHVLSVAAIATFTRQFATEFANARRWIADLALGLASLMAVAWAFAHIPREWQPLFFATIGAGTSLVGALTRQAGLSITGVSLGAFAWLLAVLFDGSGATWQQLAAVTLLPAASRLGRTLWKEEPTRNVAAYLTWASMAGITVWALRWCDLYFHQMNLTIVWTILALLFFGAGLTLRDRHYRLGGLGLLGLSVARVFFVDVWAFDPVLRILSFVVLGLVLMLVGYCYNRFEEKLRQWL